MVGIGACTKALKRLGIDVEVVDYVEIDKYACQSYNAINGTNFEPQDICAWDKDFENIDLIMHGSPCQDFSLAGLQAGGDEGSGTRSSLMYETIRIVEKIKPKYVVWENVKNLLSKKHRHNFNNYLDSLEKLGYKNYYQVLNAKDYGIPQNRERVFTISIINDVGNEFLFPHKQELHLRLKDLLEDKVDEKYYLSNTGVEYFKNQAKNRGENLEEYSEERMLCVAHGQSVGSNKNADLCPTLDTQFSNNWRGVLLEPKVDRIGGIFDSDKSTHQVGSIYDDNGLSPSLDTMQGGYRQPLLTVMTDGVVENMKIRKLTPKECWRLMRV